MSANQSVQGLWVGYNPHTSAPATTTTNCNGTSNWLALSFVSPESKTVSELSVYCVIKNANPVAADLTADVYSDTAGSPASAGSLGSVACATTPASSTWLRFTGLSVAVTAQTLYWAVFKNPNGTTGNAAVNYPTYQYGSANSAPAIWGGAGTGGYGWSRKTTTSGDGGWGSAIASICGLRVGFSDGSYLGLPISGFANTPSTSRAYGTRELGVKFVTPANATLNVRGAMLNLGYTGTPANLEFRLYTGSSTTPTLVATSNAVPHASIPTSGQEITAAFPSTVQVPGGTTCRLTVHQVSGGGDASNLVYSPADMAWDADANSTALMPYSAQRTYTADGTTFSDSQDTAASSLIPFALILDSTGPFTSAGGSTVIGARAVVIQNIGTH
jgi:hypothetical protein